MSKSKSSGVGCVILFILPFILVGVVTIYVSLTNLYSQISTKNWIDVKARIKKVNLIQTPHDKGSGYSYETECIYTYNFEKEKYTNNVISIGYGNNNTENHQELYELLKYTNSVIAYVNPDNPEESVLAKGGNSSSQSLLIFSILWNGFIVLFFQRLYTSKKNSTSFFLGFVIIFVLGITIIISGVIHTDFKNKITVLDKKSVEEIKEIEEKEREDIIEFYENNTE